MLVWKGNPPEDPVLDADILKCYLKWNIRVAKNLEILEKLTSPDGSIFHFGVHVKQKLEKF